jgi:hypothetical protein
MAIYENWVHEFSKNPGYKNPEKNVVITIGIYIPKSSKSHSFIHPSIHPSIQSFAVMGMKE